MTAIIIESGRRVKVSPSDVIAVVGLAAKGDGNPTLITSLTAAIDKYGERLSIATPSTPKTIRDYGLVDAIESIYKIVQVPIIAVNAAAGVGTTAIAPKNYTFNALGKIKLDYPNVLAPVTVTNVAGDVNYTSPADYTLDALKGELTRSSASTIPAGGTVRGAYNQPNYVTADWAAAIGRVAAVGSRTPTLIATAGIEITGAIATLLDIKAIALGATAAYTQPGATAAATVQLLSSQNAVAIYPVRTSDRGPEEASIHFVASVAADHYWESPDGDPLMGTAAVISAADAEILKSRGITLGSDRIVGSQTTNLVPFVVARLRNRAQTIANQIANNWQNKPWDLLHLEALGQAIRDALNLEPPASNLPWATVNYNNSKSSLSDKRLVYDVILKGTNANERIQSIIIYVS
jgi:hypothetical protein